MRMCVCVCMPTQSLVGLNFAQEAREADFRYGLVRVRENAESVAFYRGEPDEKALLQLVSPRAPTLWSRCTPVLRVLRTARSLSFLRGVPLQVGMTAQLPHLLPWPPRLPPLCSPSHVYTPTWQPLHTKLCLERSVCKRLWTTTLLYWSLAGIWISSRPFTSESRRPNPFAPALVSCLLPVPCAAPASGGGELLRPADRQPEP